MNILSYVERGSMLVITTDNADPSVFVYPIDKFNNLPALKREIRKKIEEINKRKIRKDDEKGELVRQLDLDIRLRNEMK